MNLDHSNSPSAQDALIPLASPSVGRIPITTPFGKIVDVRNRGALRVSRLVSCGTPCVDTPAVVRVWTGDKCRELSIGEARELAEQLVQAARFAELQNAH